MAKAQPERPWRPAIGRHLPGVIVALPWLSFACGQQDNHHTTQVQGGVAIYGNGDVRVLDASAEGSRFASLVLGLQQLEIIQASAHGATIVPVPLPVFGPQAQCRERAPLAMATGDLTADGLTDVLVMDPCENWVALDANTSFQPGVWGDVLPDAPTYHYVDVYDWPDPSGMVLVMGSQRGLVLRFRVEGQSTWSPPISISLSPPYASTRTTRLFIPIDGALDDGRRSVAVQQQGRLSLVSIREEAGAVTGVIERELDQVVELPNLQPFAAYDHLTPLRISGCPPRALGVSTFDVTAGKVPRELQLLQFDDNSGVAETFRATVIKTGLDVTTFSVAPSPDGETQHVGIIGMRNNNDWFALWEVTDCSSLRLVAELEIDFDFKTPPAPAFRGSGVVEKTLGSRLFSHRESSSTLLFGHYDGYDLRTIHAAATVDGWALTFDKQSVHVNRTDLSYADQ
jgi:hypothetical protein